MKTSPIVLAALLVQLAPPGTAQHDDARVLLAGGDTLAGGRTVVRIHDLDLDPVGRWAAHVDVRRSSGFEAAAIVVDGELVLEQGDVLPSGERVAAIAGARLGDDGSLLVNYYVITQPSGLVVDSRLALNGVEVLRERDQLVVPTLPEGVLLGRIRMFDIAGDHVLCICDLSFPGGETQQAAIHYTLVGGALVAPEVLSLQGTTSGGLTRPIDEYLPSIALARDGSHVTSFVQQWGVEGETAGHHNGAAAFETGSPAPMGAGTWESVTPRVACAVGTGYIAGGAVTCLACAPTRGIVANETVLYALSGTPLAASPTETVASFLETDVALAETGEAIFTVPLTNGDHVLVAGDEIVLRTGTSRASGQLVTGIRFADLDSLDVSPAGHLILLEVELEGGVDAIVLVERDAGTVEPCSVAANVTGSIGTLRALGSRYLSANTLRLEAADLPSHSFGVALTSRTSGHLPHPGGSVGVMCLSGGIGQILPVGQAGVGGALSLDVDLESLPQPLGPVAAAVGETWRFQVWYRDTQAPGAPTSNFTQAVAVTLR